jgi:ankyrin repeat protein
MTEYSTAPTFVLDMLPAGDPAQGNQTTVVMCAVKMLHGAVVISSTDECAYANVLVLPATVALRYPPSELINALQSSDTALLGATVMAEQLSSGGFEGGAASEGDLAVADIFAVVSAHLADTTLSAGRFSRLMYIMRRLVPTSHGKDVPALGETVAVIATAAARLIDASHGEPERALQLGDDVLDTLSVILDGRSISQQVVTQRALVEVTEALDRVVAVGLQAAPISNDVHALGPLSLRALLYKGDIASSLWRTWSFADDDDTAGQRSRRRLLRIADTARSAVGSRKGDAVVVINDLVAPGCGNARDTLDCLPQGVGISLTYIADSSHIYSGLGDAEFRRAASVWGWPLREQDAVHTVSGLVSVGGSNVGALIPSLAIQLPLDMQAAGVNDLREDNKFCARVNYEEMRLAIVGPVQVRTAVQQYPGGWAVGVHSGVCWADMYGDYVLVQVSRPSSNVTAARGFVSPRADHLRAEDTFVFNPPQTSTAMSKDKLQMIVFTAAVVGIGCLAVVAGIVENCRESRRPRGSSETGKISKSRRIEASLKISDADVWAVGTTLQRDLSRVPSPTSTRDHDSVDCGDDTPRSGGPGRIRPVHRNLSMNAGHDYPHIRSLKLKGAQQWLHPESLAVPLHAALLRDGAEDLEETAARAENINEAGSDGRSALHIAATCGRVDAVRFLIRRGDVLPNLADAYGHTPLHLAAIYGQASVAEALLAGNSSGVWVLDMEALECAETEAAYNAESNRSLSGAKVDVVDKEGCTPLHIAAHFGAIDVASVILRAGGDSELAVSDVHGNTPLHHAAMRGCTDALLVMLRYCLRNEERTEWPMLKNVEGLVAADLAAVHGHGETLEALLLWGEQCNINVTRPHGDGVSLMTLATFHGKRAVSRVIRRNEWWMWEVAPEEVVLDGDELRRNQRSFSAVAGGATELFASEARRLMLHTSGRLTEAKDGIRHMVHKLSCSYRRAGYSDPGTDSSEEANFSHSRGGSVSDLSD